MWSRSIRVGAPFGLLRWVGRLLTHLDGRDALPAPVVVAVASKAYVTGLDGYILHRGMKPVKVVT